MSVLLTREITSLKKKILQMTALVEESVRKAVGAVKNKNEALAEEVVRSDDQIDLMENELEEECLKILALHQPVAADLRYVVVCLKINNDLERIGDLAVNIADRAKAISKEDDDFMPEAIFKMIDIAMAMLKKSLDAFIEMDSGLAAEVSLMDDSLDEYNRSMYGEVKKLIMESPERTGYLLHLLGVSRQLERMGDYATNIAEDVIYMIDARIVRHSR